MRPVRQRSKRHKGMDACLSLGGSILGSALDGELLLVCTHELARRALVSSGYVFHHWRTQDGRNVRAWKFCGARVL